MNNKKFCFITCVNNEEFYSECLYYINNLNKSQFYYHRRRLKKTEEPILQAVKLENKQENRKQVDDALEVNIAIGNANISIPVSETTLITSIIKELVIKC